jgi:Plasmid encoded RepA protein/Phage integrase family
MPAAHYHHGLLCQLGLPRRKPKERVFERRSGDASLLLEAGRWWTGRSWEPQPLPFGTRPRLVMINVCSEAVRTRSATVNVGDSVRGFLRRIGVDGGGNSMAGFKRQMIALSCCHMVLGYSSMLGVGQVDTKPISRFEAWLCNEDRQHGLWPGELDLSPPFFASLMEHAVPLDPEALARLQNSAFAIDIYTWLANRLPRVRERAGVVVSWHALKLAEFRSHDLRRTVATWLGEAGIAAEVIERVLNHAPQGVTDRHYNHAALREPMRRALDAWAVQLRAIVDGKAPASNVERMRAGEAV